MTHREEQLRQELMKLVYGVGCGLATGQPPAALVDVLDELMPELRRLRGEAWLEHQEKTLKPRKRRMTAARRTREILEAVRVRKAREAAGVGS